MKECPVGHACRRFPQLCEWLQKPRRNGDFLGGSARVRQKRLPVLHPTGRVVVQGVDLVHRHAQGIGEVPCLVGRPRAIHAVQDGHAREPQIPHLEGEDELALQGGGVEHEDDGVGPRFGRKQEILGDPPVVGLGVKVVKPGQVVDGPILGTVPLAGRHVGDHGDPRQIAHPDAHARQAMEQRGLSSVGVADECEVHGRKLTSEIRDPQSLQRGISVQRLVSQARGSWGVRLSPAIFHTSKCSTAFSPGPPRTVPRKVPRSSTSPFATGHCARLEYTVR